MQALDFRKILYCAVNLGLIAWSAAKAADVLCMGLLRSIDRPAVYHENESAEQSVASSHQFRPFSSYQAIITRDLFGTRHLEAVKSQDYKHTSQLETAQLGVRLWGTVSGNDSLRFAVIEIHDGGKRGQQHLFREGDTIREAVIERILRDKVVVSLNGREQLLPLEEYKSPTMRKPLANAAVLRGRVSRRFIQRATLEKAVNNVGQLMTQARIVPRKDGLAITAIKPGSLFQRLGLRNGDLIQGVNGRVIQSVDDALSIYNRFRNDKTVNVDIQRGGRKRTMQYAIR